MKFWGSVVVWRSSLIPIFLLFEILMPIFPVKYLANYNEEIRPRLT